MDAQPELTARQRRIIPFLLSHNIVDACRLARVSRKSVWEWMKEEGFQEELKRARDELFADSLELIRGNVEKAVNKLVTLMEEAEKQDVQIRAAENILEYAVRLKQMEELEKRLEILEAAVGRGR
jgi:hypothetical protein